RALQAREGAHRARRVARAEMSLLHRCVHHAMPGDGRQSRADDGGGACGRRDAGRHHARALGADAEPPEEDGALSPLVQLKVVQEKSKYDFEGLLRARGIDLPPLSVDTLQVNVTKLCNQVCRHCHVDASPKRTEMLSPEGVAKCLEILGRHPQITKLDITGGAPELHPRFDAFVEKAVALGKHVMVRHNLTVQLDGNPVTGESKKYLPQFFARNRLEVICSLPYYQEYFTDAQRGSGVFKKSMEAMRRLNVQGYGVEGSGLALNLVYNPVGPYLPAAQAGLEADYKRELKSKFGLVFNNLYTITNMPINR